MTAPSLPLMNDAELAAMLRRAADGLKGEHYATRKPLLLLAAKRLDELGITLARALLIGAPLTGKTPDSDRRD